jgi:hypothetical protein
VPTYSYNAISFLIDGNFMKTNLIILALLVSLGLVANFEAKADTTTWTCKHLYKFKDEPSQLKNLETVIDPAECHRLVREDDPVVTEEYITKYVLEYGSEPTTQGHDCNAIIRINSGPYQ